MKMCEMNYFSSFYKSYLVLFLTFIIGTPILCCTITDSCFFSTFLGIFGVEFVRTVLCRQRIGHELTALLR